MDKIFSDYRTNKNISRKGVDSLLSEVKQRMFDSGGILSFTPIGGAPELLQDWEVYRNKSNNLKFISLQTGKNRIKTSILNMLTFSPVVGFVLICFTDQKYKEDFIIKELWGYRIKRGIRKTTLEKVDHEELYEYCTTDFSSGKSIPPQEEVVYCGPNGKICGWDKV